MKNAIVTGASTGIGRVTAIQMAEAGYQVFLLARSKERLEKVCKEIESSGGKAFVVTTDLSKVEDLFRAIILIKSKVDKIDAIINIAGVWHGKDDVYAGIDFQDFDTQVIWDTYFVGLVSPTYLVHGLLGLMESGGKIVNLSGTFEDGAKGWLPYYVSKRAMEDFTVGLSQELKENGIQVNCVSPSDTSTESYKKFFPQYVEESVEPEKIAQTIVELCDNDNITGKVIVIKKGREPLYQFHA